MNKYQWIMLGSLITGLLAGGFSISNDLEGGFWHWFMFGTCACFYIFVFNEALDVISEWRISQPKFLGFKYWIKKALRIEI